MTEKKRDAKDEEELEAFRKRMEELGIPKVEHKDSGYFIITGPLVKKFQEYHERKRKWEEEKARREKEEKGDDGDEDTETG